jgi:hypothetical protein
VDYIWIDVVTEIAYTQAQADIAPAHVCENLQHVETGEWYTQE